MCSRPLMSGSAPRSGGRSGPGAAAPDRARRGRLVAAIRITPSFASNPSISTSSWFRVCSRSSLPPPRPAPRWRPTASISSMMKMMQGAFFLPCSNMSRTRLAPTPTNISTKSEPEMVKNGTLASPAMARASKVLPVPGGPDQQAALRNLAAEALEFLRILQELDDLLELALASSMPATSSKVTRPARSFKQARLGLAEAHGLAAIGLHLAHHEDPGAAMISSGAPVDEEGDQRARGIIFRLGGDVHALGRQHLDQLRVFRRVSREGRAVGQVTGDRMALGSARSGWSHPGPGPGSPGSGRSSSWSAHGRSGCPHSGRPEKGRSRAP